MKHNWTVFYMEKERNNESGCPAWGRTISGILSLGPAIFVFGGSFLLHWNNVYVSVIIALIYWFIAYKMGCTGYIIGNKIKNFVAPSKIYVNTPSIGDIFSLKFYWKYSCQLNGILIGSVLIHIIILKVIFNILVSLKGA